jgi:hypothetical protein
MLLVCGGGFAVLAEEEDWWEVGRLAAGSDGGFGFSTRLIFGETERILIEVS